MDSDKPDAKFAVKECYEYSSGSFAFGECACIRHHFGRKEKDLSVRSLVKNGDGENQGQDSQRK